MKETLNLLPDKERPKDKKGIFFYLAIVFSLYLLTVTGLWGYNISISKRLDSAVREHEGLRANLLSQVAAKEPAAPPPPSIEKEIADKAMRTPPWDAILGELSVSVPEKVWLSLIDIKESEGSTSISIKGFSKTQVDVAELISGLEESSYFSDIEIVFSQKTAKDVIFELKAKIKWT